MIQTLPAVANLRYTAVLSEAYYISWHGMALACLCKLYVSIVLDRQRLR